jgi:cell division septation protein DedD
MRDFSTSENNEVEKHRRVYRFELNAPRLVLYSFCLVLALCWMFVFGVLVGRGIPLADLEGTSLYSQLARALGLGRPPVQVVENASETWDPQTALKSLEYYENLTRKDAPPPERQASRDSIAQGKGDPKDSTAQLAKPSGPDAGAEAGVARSEGEKDARLARDSSVGIRGEEHFTLLVVSLRDAANAAKLVEQLKAKGYSPRLQNVDLNTGGRWNRVLVGSFGSREEAMRFAAEFNRKEHMEGLVIRETQ